MADLASLRANCARADVDYGGFHIAVFYRPALVNAKTQDVLQKLQEDGNFRPLHEELRKILITWDVTLDGVVIPFTEEGFTAVGIGVIGSITNTLVAAVGKPLWVGQETIPPPPPTEHPSIRLAEADSSPTPSSSGSSTTDVSDAAPTTSTPSSPPNGLTSHPGSSPAYPTPQTVSAGPPGSAT
jgi:hypothetical protein